MTDASTSRQGPAGVGARGSVRVWDPLVRVFHWALVAAFATAWLTADELKLLHNIAGYMVAGLVAFRVTWGLFGPRHARFTQFLRGPRATLSFVGDMLRGRERRYLGHNPAGAAMIAALLLSLSGTAFTGWLVDNPTRIAMLPDLPQIVTPAQADDDGKAEGAKGLLKDLHEMLANLLVVLVALHVGGVVLASIRHHENLARAMVTGDKRAPGPDDIA